MKIVLVSTILILCGCAATPPPKETVRDIFSLIRDGRIRQSDEIYNQTPDGVPFEVYSENNQPKAISAREMDRLVTVATDFINLCELLIEKAAGIAENYNPVYSDPIDPIKSDFDSKCNPTTNKTLHTDLARIKTISTIDFFSEYESLHKRFGIEVAKIDAVHAEEQQKKSNAEESAKKKIEFESSPAFYSQKLCEMKGRIKLGNRVIQKENEAAQISGYVDKRKLYEAGKIIQINQDNIKHWSNEYKKKFGKSWSESECQK